MVFNKTQSSILLFAFADRTKSQKMGQVKEMLKMSSKIQTLQTCFCLVWVFIDDSSSRG